MSKSDYTDPVYKLHGENCGTGNIGWNTVISSPFAKEASVEVWDDLPMLLDRLWAMSDDDLQRLQVTRFGHFFCTSWVQAIQAPREDNTPINEVDTAKGRCDA